MEPSKDASEAAKHLPKGLHRNDPIAFHNHLAATWEANYRSKAFLSRVNAFESALGERELQGMCWLDAGCGSGTLTRWLAKRGAEVVGVDGAPAMIRAARAAMVGRECEGRLRFEVANVGSLPFSDATFDAVLCSSVLEYAQDPTSYLNEIARVIKPGGILLISIPNAESLVRMGLRITYQLTNMIGAPRPRYMMYSRHQYSRSAFSALLRKCGYEPEYATAFGGGLPLWLDRRSWLGRLLLLRAVRL
jgi:2-polyprenyl-3-methyl-5-hydroxy-6-metoxy-1,4-benzoquinol methylase